MFGRRFCVYGMAMQRNVSRPGFSLPARLRSFGHALAGIGHLLRHEHNARVHLAATAAVILAGGELRIAAADWRWLIAAIGLVWLAEAINTAIERLCDIVSPGFHPGIRIVKDVAAGAVLLAAITAAAIGGATLGPYLLQAARG